MSNEGNDDDILGIILGIMKWYLLGLFVVVVRVVGE